MPLGKCSLVLKSLHLHFLRQPSVKRSILQVWILAFPEGLEKKWRSGLSLLRKPFGKCSFRKSGCSIFAKTSWKTFVLEEKQKIKYCIVWPFPAWRPCSWRYLRYWPDPGARRTTRTSHQHPHDTRVSPGRSVPISFQNCTPRTTPGTKKPGTGPCTPGMHNLDCTLEFSHVKFTSMLPLNFAAINIAIVFSLIPSARGTVPQPVATEVGENAKPDIAQKTIKIEQLLAINAPYTEFTDDERVPRMSQNKIKARQKSLTLQTNYICLVVAPCSTHSRHNVWHVRVEIKQRVIQTDKNSTFTSGCKWPQLTIAAERESKSNDQVTKKTSKPKSVKHPSKNLKIKQSRTIL